jgi:hypothetical protein
MLEYARIFAYRTDMNLIGRDGRTDAQTTLLIVHRTQRFRSLTGPVYPSISESHKPERDTLDLTPVSWNCAAVDSRKIASIEKTRSLETEQRRGNGLVRSEPSDLISESESFDAMGMRERNNRFSMPGGREGWAGGPRTAFGFFARMLHSSRRGNIFSTSSFLSKECKIKATCKSRFLLTFFSW